MKASDLTREQRQAITSHIQPSCGYLYKLATRMQQVGWDPNDLVYVKARRDREVMAELLMELYGAGSPRALPPDTAPK